MNGKKPFSLKVKNIYKKQILEGKKNNKKYVII